MRIATYNVEWMDSLFDAEGELRADDGWSGRYNVTRRAQAEALRRVLRALNADAIMIIEAPDGHRRRDGVAALQNFAAWSDLRTRSAVMGFVNETQQEIALLYDPKRLSPRHDPQSSAEAPQFDTEFEIDLDVDAHPDRVRWSKPPLELSVETAGGRTLRMIGVHAKSKAPHGAKGRAAIMQVSIASRRKQLAQCIWLRARAVEHLARGEALMILGDFNDGPGLDEYERLFGRSGVEIVLAPESALPLYDPHAAMAVGRRLSANPTTARFWQADARRWLSVLLDYIMVSPDLRARSPVWKIWHPFDDPDCYGNPELREALLTASDHFPVVCEIDF